MDLTHIKHILCRSQAEYETLLNLLSLRARRMFDRKIGISAKVHFRKWTFAETVDLSKERVTFRFSPQSITPGPFHAELAITDPKGKPIGHAKDQAFMARGAYTFTLEKLRNPESYRVSLSLDGSLAYFGVFRATEALL
jgi:hypothetical protein